MVRAVDPAHQRVHVVQGGPWRFTAKTRIPMARTRVATARPMSPYPTMPTVWPARRRRRTGPIAGFLVADHAPEVFGEIQNRAQREFAERLAEDAAAVGQGNWDLDLGGQHIVESGSTRVDPS